MTESNKFSDEEIKKLKETLAIAAELEKVSVDQNFDQAKLAQLIDLLRSFSNFENRDLQRLGQIADHLSPSMSLQHFLNFIIPIERLLDRSLSDQDFLIRSQDRQGEVSALHSLYFVLHNLRSSFNVGSILRTADALAVGEIVFSGYTPLPNSQGVIKTAMGSTLPWRRARTLTEALEPLKASGVQICGLETTQQSRSLHRAEFNKATAFVVGNERFGLSPSELKLCDQIVELPMLGSKNSLNVAVSLAVAGYEWLRQHARNK